MLESPGFGFGAQAPSFNPSSSCRGVEDKQKPNRFEDNRNQTGDGSVLDLRGKTENFLAQQ